MKRGRFTHLALASSLLGGLPLWAQSPSPSGSNRPLPHPDILILPAEGSAATPAPGTAASPGADAAAGTESATGGESAESKVVLRPQGSANPAAADGETRTVTRRIATDGSGLFRDLWPLLAVLALIAGIAFVLKKYMPSRRMLAGSQALEIVARTHVSSKQQLMLVRLGRRLVLIGVSPERMSLLSTVEDPEQVASLMGEIASTSPRSMSRAFAESMDDEAEAYVELPVNDPTRATQGQLHGLIHKVRTLSGKTP